jgi:hypothetical protein
LQAELNKVVVEDGGVESGIQTDAKKTNQRATTNNSKHHSLLACKNKFLEYLKLDVFGYACW